MDSLSRTVAALYALELPAFMVAQALGMLVAAWLFARRLPRVRGPRRLLALAVPLGAALGAVGLGALLAAPALLAGRAGDRAGLLMAFGGLGGAALGALAAGRAAKVSAPLSLDAVAPSLGVLVLFGRIGCCLAGCCFGPLLDGGVRYPAGSPCFIEHVRQGLISAEASASLPVAPIQLGEVALGALMIALGLARPRGAAGPTRRGLVFAVVVAVYAAGRFALEGLRADPRPITAGLSVAQWLALGTLAAVAGLWPSRSGSLA